MKRLHTSILALFGWFFVFYNVERLYEPINLASFVYLLAPALGMAMLSMTRLHRVPIYWFIPVAIAGVVSLRSYLGYPLGQDALGLIVLESSAVWITVWLSSQISQGIDEYRNAAATAIFAHVSDRCRPFEEAQADVICEVRRARQSNRSIAVLALNPVPHNEQETLDRFTDEFKAALLRQYVSAQAAECLSMQLRQHDILTQTQDQFLALLPEMTREQALHLADEMRQSLREKLGVDLHVGLSMFPEDEITAIGLIEKAEADVDSIRHSAAIAAKELRPSSGNQQHVANEINDQMGASNKHEIESVAP